MKIMIQKANQPATRQEIDEMVTKPTLFDLMRWGIKQSDILHAKLHKIDGEDVYLIVMI